MKIINDFVFNKIKEKDEYLGKQFEETLSCNYIVTFNKGEEYSFEGDSIILKQDLTAYVEITNTKGNMMSVAFESLAYGNDMGEGFVGYVLLSSQDYFNKVPGYTNIQTKLPYDKTDLNILVNNIEDMSYEIEELEACQELNMEGDIIDIYLPSHLVELQKEYIKNIKEINLPEVFKNNPDLTEDMKKDTLENIYRSTNVIIQTQKKQIQNALRGS